MSLEKEWRPIILVASGNSIPFNNNVFKNSGNGLPLHLREILENNYSIGMNYFYKYGTPNCTINMFTDWQFYRDNVEELKELPLVMGSKHNQLIKKDMRHIIQNNTILIQFVSKYFGKDSWEKGFYSAHFVSLLSITLAIALGFNEIYLLGLDAKMIDGKTHFYQDMIDITKKDGGGKNLKFRGVGTIYNEKKDQHTYRTSDYNDLDKLNKLWYTVYNRENVKIYNVSPESGISAFPKIRYQKFYDRFRNIRINQEDARNNIKEYIRAIYTEGTSDILYTNLFNNTD